MSLLINISKDPVQLLRSSVWEQTTYVSHKIALVIWKTHFWSNMSNVHCPLSTMIDQKRFTFESHIFSD